MRCVARPRVRRALPISALLASIVVLAPSAFAETDSVRFDFDPADPSAEHTWTVPDDVTEVTIEAAGGGGGGTENTTSSAENTGGNGALVTVTIAAVAGETFSVGIGGAGTGRRDHSGGGGGGGASILTGGNVTVIAGGGGGAGVTGDGGDGGGVNGRGGNGGPAGQAFGKGGKDGIGGKTNHWHPSFLFNGRDFTLGDSTDDGRGYGGAAVGGAGSSFQSYNQGGLGGAGYGGGAAGTWGGRGYSRGGGAGGSTAQGAAVDVDTISYSSAGGAGGAGNVAGQAGWVIITWVVPVRAQVRTAAGSAEATPSTPVTFRLSMPDGMTCAAPSLDPSSIWVRLPAQEDCAGSISTRSTQEASLLGWATTPDFPVTIAQRQIDNGWGAHELRDDDGNLTAVFIPAGGWTQASSDTSLFPIWAEESTD